MLCKGKLPTYAHRHKARSLFDSVCLWNVLLDRSYLSPCVLSFVLLFYVSIIVVIIIIIIIFFFFFFFFVFFFLLSFIFFCLSCCTIHCLALFLLRCHFSPFSSSCDLVEKAFKKLLLAKVRVHHTWHRPNLMKTHRFMNFHHFI